jgi:hypothetical protein
MRNFVAATLAATLIASSALAATDSGAPLPSGKPAGVTKAQDTPDNTIWYVVAGAIIIGGIALVASNGNSTLVTGTTTTTTTR